MQLKDYINEILEEDIIGKIYYNDLEGIHQSPENPEYSKLTHKIREAEKEILNENENSTELKKYMEYVNERTGIEAENQFKIGFKTAVKIILEALK